MGPIPMRVLAVGSSNPPAPPARGVEPRGAVLLTHRWAKIGPASPPPLELLYQRQGQFKVLSGTLSTGCAPFIDSTAPANQDSLMSCPGQLGSEGSRPNHNLDSLRSCPGRSGSSGTRQNQKKTGHTATGRACTFRWSQVLSPPRQFNVMSKTIWLGRQSPAQEASFDRLMPEMLALLQSGEHHGSRQKADS